MSSHLKVQDKMISNIKIESFFLILELFNNFDKTSQR